MRVVTVLRKGPEYHPEHVARLAKQVRQFHPDAELVTLTDFPASQIREHDDQVEVIPLVHDWPGWWAKMEIYGPTLSGDVFYIDLDSTIVAPIDELLTVERSTGLSDFYRPDILASGLLYVIDADRAPIFEFFMRQPRHYIAHYRHRGLLGDQGVLSHFKNAFDRWQVVRPGLVVSYKVDIKHNMGVLPDGAALVCFHGKPRPWTISQPWTTSDDN